MTELIKKTPTALAQTERAEALDAARHYAQQSKAASTWRAYASDWRIFEQWCVKAELASLPAEPHTVCLFLSRQAAQGTQPATLRRRLAAIRMVHRSANQPSPHDAVAVAEVLSGIQRDVGVAPLQKAPAVAEDVQRMADACNVDTKVGCRDRAVLLFGFAGAFRRSELVALETTDLIDHADKGVEVIIRRSKTDQVGAGQRIALVREAETRYCPVAALDTWRARAVVTDGPLFRRISRGDHVRDTALSAQSVALIVKKYAAQVGLDACQFAGHSLRSGFLTSAARNRASLFKMQEVSRHKSLDVLQGYVRDAEKFDDHAGEGLLGSAEISEG
ncbi:MAG: site-specific integrase [Pseudomonadales bacterium]